MAAKALIGQPITPRQSDAPKQHAIQKKWRNGDPVAAQQAAQVQARHGSRKSGLPATQQRRVSSGAKKSEAVPTGQGDLFGGNNE